MKPYDDIAAFQAPAPIAGAALVVVVLLVGARAPREGDRA
jgi:hypothetical protein